MGLEVCLNNLKLHEKMTEDLSSVLLQIINAASKVPIPKDLPKDANVKVYISGNLNPTVQEIDVKTVYYEADDYKNPLKVVKQVYSNGAVLTPEELAERNKAQPVTLRYVK